VLHFLHEILLLQAGRGALHYAARCPSVEARQTVVPLAQEPFKKKKKNDLGYNFYGTETGFFFHDHFLKSFSDLSAIFYVRSGFGTWGGGLV
jgi:hypothetical protein